MKEQLIDIGINLMHRSFMNDREDVLEEAYQEGVTPLIITGTSVRASEQAATYAKKHPQKVYSTAGVHPHDAKSCNGETIGKLRKLSKLPQVVAIGECGLDYDRDFSPRPVQQKWFEEQIQLAKEEHMPLFLHERAAFEDFKAILSNEKEMCEKSVVHCFTGSFTELQAYLEMGCYIGITGWICDERRGMHLRDIVNIIPSDKLLIETDAPFLTPRNLPVKPQENRNEAKYLTHIAAEIAECRGETLEELAKSTTENAKRFFGIA